MSKIRRSIAEIASGFKKNQNLAITRPMLQTKADKFAQFQFVRQNFAFFKIFI